MNAKVRKLDISQAMEPYVAQNFQNHVRQGLKGLENPTANWKTTEKVMMHPAMPTFSPKEGQQIVTWETDASRQKLSVFSEQYTQLRRDKRLPSLERKSKLMRIR